MINPSNEIQKSSAQIERRKFRGAGWPGIDEDMFEKYASEIKQLTSMGVQVAVVIGGGNIFRGLSGVKMGFDRVRGDQMGMLATVINSIGLSLSLKGLGVDAVVYSAHQWNPLQIIM